MWCSTTSMIISIKIPVLNNTINKETFAKSCFHILIKALHVIFEEENLSILFSVANVTNRNRSIISILKEIIRICSYCFTIFLAYKKCQVTSPMCMCHCGMRFLRACVRVCTLMCARVYTRVCIHERRGSMKSLHRRRTKCYNNKNPWEIRISSRMRLFGRINKINS